MWWEFFLIQFSTEIAVYLGNGTKKAHGCYWTLIESHRWRIRVNSDDLEWPRKKEHEGQIFRADLLNTVWPRTAKFCRITCWGGVYFKRVSDTPITQGDGIQALPNLVVPFYLCIYLWRITTKFDVVTDMGRELVSKWSLSHTPPQGAGSKRSPILGFLSIYAYTLCRRTNKFDVLTHVEEVRVS